MPTITKACLDNGIQEKCRSALVRYLNNPTPTVDDWNEIHGILLYPRGRVSTVWQAVCQIDNRFQKNVRFHAKNGFEWERVPDPMMVARAIKKLLNA